MNGLQDQLEQQHGTQTQLLEKKQSISMEMASLLGQMALCENPEEAVKIGAD